MVAKPKWVVIHSLRGLCLALGVTLSACGGSVKNEKGAAAGSDSVFHDKQGVKSELGRKLEIRFIPSLKGHLEKPDFGSAPIVSSSTGFDGTYVADPETGVMISGNTVLIESPICLLEQDQQTERHLFLAWPEYIDGERIVDAHYLHQEETFDHKKRFAEVRGAANKDAAQRTWFLPIQEVIGRNSVDVDAATLHSITLDLQFQTRGVSQLHVKFKLSGKLPVARMTQEQFPPSNAILNAAEKAALYAKPESLPYLATIKNESKRALRLWVSVTPQLTLSSLLGVRRWKGMEHSPPESRVDRYRSEGRFETVGIQSTSVDKPGFGEEWTTLRYLKQTDSDVYSSRLSPQGQLLSILLPPLKNTHFRFLVQPEEGARNCTIPEARPITATWTTSRVEVVTLGGNRDGSDRSFERVRWDGHSTSVTESWSIEQVGFKGTLAARFWLTDEELPESEFLKLTKATEPDLNHPRIRELSLEGESISFISGQGPKSELDFANAPLFECQGFFAAAQAK